jgi:hypothetical protein
LKLVLVKWLDSHTSMGWRDPREVNPEPAACITVGYVVHDTKASLTLAQSLQDDNTRNVNGCMVIPKVCITSVRKLK